FRRSVLLPGEQGVAHPHPARTGGSRRRQDRPIHQGDREPTRLDHAAAVVGGLDRTTPLRRLAAVASSARHHRAPPARRHPHRAGASIGLAMDVVASGADLSNDPMFAEAVARKVYYGPVYFRRESEPYMTLAIAGTRRDAGVSVAEVNLKLIWDVVSQIKVGE